MQQCTFTKLQKPHELYSLTNTREHQENKTEASDAEGGFTDNLYLTTHNLQLRKYVQLIKMDPQLMKKDLQLMKEDLKLIKAAL